MFTQCVTIGIIVDIEPTYDDTDDGDGERTYNSFLHPMTSLMVDDGRGARLAAPFLNPDL